MNEIRSAHNRPRSAQQHQSFQVVCRSFCFSPCPVSVCVRARALARPCVSMLLSCVYQIFLFCSVYISHWDFICPSMCVMSVCLVFAFGFVSSLSLLLSTVSLSPLQVSQFVSRASQHLGSLAPLPSLSVGHCASMSLLCTPLPSPLPRQHPTETVQKFILSQLNTKTKQKKLHSYAEYERTHTLHRPCKQHMQHRNACSCEKRIQYIC